MPPHRNCRRTRPKEASIDGPNADKVGGSVGRALTSTAAILWWLAVNYGDAMERPAFVTKDNQKYNVVTKDNQKYNVVTKDNQKYNVITKDNQKYNVVTKDNQKYYGIDLLKSKLCG